MAAARMLVLAAALAALAACGDKVPESQAAKKIGAVPKQTVDKATDDAAKALEQGAQRTRDGAQ
jgi:predicted small lipoprotein YifL